MGFATMQELVVSHFVTGAVATCLLTKTRTSPAAQTKPGKAPKGVDYIGTSHLATICCDKIGAVENSHDV